MASDVKPVGYRLPPDLIRMIKIDAAQSGLHASQVVAIRMAESFARHPEPTLEMTNEADS